MKSLNAKDRSCLSEMFGSRVSFDERERKLYGHDIAALPGLIKPFLGKTIPDAVVQPEDEKGNHFPGTLGHAESYSSHSPWKGNLWLWRSTAS